MSDGQGFLWLAGFFVSDEIRLLINNLLNNSIDALSQGGQIRVRVSSATQWRGNGRFGVRITVADTGSGIAPGVRCALFEPFFTTKKEVGTGLGLWLWKGIVERHRGWIQLKSSTAPGKSWTVFSVFLPIIRTTIGRGGTAGSMKDTRVYQPLGAASAPRPFIVVVDDERRIADAIALILNTRDYAAEPAHDGASPLEICRHRLPDLVVTDVAMPGMNGIELAIAIRRQFPGCQILLFSGQAETLDSLKMPNASATTSSSWPNQFTPKSCSKRLRS